MRFRILTTLLLAHLLSSCVSPTFVVTSEPPGAKVFIHGRYYGKTPCSIPITKEELKKGKTVKVSAQSKQGEVVSKEVKVKTVSPAVKEVFKRSIAVPLIIAGVVIANDYCYSYRYSPRSHRQRVAFSHHNSGDLEDLVIAAAIVVVSYAVIDTIDHISATKEIKTNIHLDFKKRKEK